MERCKKCDDLLFSFENHSCTPFTVIDENGDESEVYARDEDDAAVRFAQKSNEDGDYYLMNNCVDIEVNGKEYSISAEPDIHYSAALKG